MDHTQQEFYIACIVAGVASAACIILLIMVFKASKNLKRAQQQNQTSNDTLDALTTGAVLLDQAQQIVYCNAAAANLLGRKKDNLIGHPFMQVWDVTGKQFLDDLKHDNNDSLLPFSHILTSQASNLSLSVSLEDAPISLTSSNKNVRWLVSFSDVDNLCDQINTKTTAHQFASMGLSAWNVQHARLCHDDKCLSALPECFEALGLQSNEQGFMAFEEMLPFIFKQDHNIWNKALRDLQKPDMHQTLEFELRFVDRNEPVNDQNTSELATAQSASANNLNQRSIKYFRFKCVYSPSCSSHWQCYIRDITKQHNLEQQTQLSELKIHTLISMSPEPIYLLDEQGRLISCNGAFERLFGVRGGQLKDKEIEHINIFPDTLAKMHVCAGHSKDNAANIRTVRINQTLIYDLSSPNNLLNQTHETYPETVKKLHVIAQSVKDEDTQTAIVFGFVKDLTGLLTADNELKKAQQHFKTIVDLAPVAIATIDDNDHLVSANTTMLARLGLAESELNSGNFYELFSDPSSSGKIAKELHKTGRVRNFNTHLKGKNKELHPSEIHIDLFNSEKQEYLCWITDKSAEQFQQDRFENLLEHSSIPMAVLGEFGFTQVNPATMRFFKTQDKQALIHVHPYTPELNGEDAEHLKHIIAQVKATGQAQSIAWQHLVKQQVLPCHLTLVPMYKGKEFDSILCVWVDLSALQQADHERQQAIELQKQAQENAQKAELSAAKAEQNAQTVQEKFESSQSLLAKQEKTLAETSSKLDAVKSDLNAQKNQYNSLKEEHHCITENLNALQNEYQQSRSQLQKAQVDNNELTQQLKTSTRQVEVLEGQRTEISDTLLESQRNYAQTKQALLESEQRAQTLEQSKQEYLAQMQQYKRQMNDMQSSIDDKDQQIEQVAQKITELQGQLSDSDQVQERLSEQLFKQREESIEAEKHRQSLERTVLQAKSELENKEANLQHIQSEMSKLEEMSQQEKGDMQAQQQKLEAELLAKQTQLTTTEATLKATAQEAERERLEKQQQQAKVEQVSQELKEIEQKAVERQQELDKIEQQRKHLESEMQDTLLAKQQQIHSAEKVLSEAKQQTEAEKAEKLQKEERLKLLQQEVQELTATNQSKLDEFERKEQQSRELQLRQASEVAAKKQQLNDTQSKLEAMQQQAENERIARLAQQQKVEQLTQELSDVQGRADKQKDMLAGNDEQWREHHAEIEKQKREFQLALHQAQAHSQKLEAQLSGNLQELAQAEDKVSSTQSDEQRLQSELEELRAQSKQLNAKLADQENKENSLHAQVKAQQIELEGREQSIQNLQSQQQQLSEQLAQVQQEYENSKVDMHEQQQSQSQLSQKLQSLESELHLSKDKLKDKEQALQSAKQELEHNQSTMIEQEKTLLEARQLELQQARQHNDETPIAAQHNQILDIELPANPDNWFALLPYLQSQSHVQSLPIALQQLIDEMQTLIASTDDAVNTDNRAKMLTSAKQLVDLSQKVNADGLTDVLSHMQNDNPQVLLDTISIAWPNIKKALQNTLRVIYSNLIG